MVISHRVWQDRFGGRADVVGRTVRANGETMTIVGVAGKGFRFPFNQDLWIALHVDPLGSPRGEGALLDVFGRLEEGVSRDEAASQLASIARQLELEYPKANAGVGVILKPFSERFMPAEITAVLFAMLGGVFGIGGMIGGYLGAKTQKHIAQRPIKIGLFIILILVAGKYLAALWG